MSNGTNQAIIYVGGAVALAGIAYYAHQAGFFTAAFKALNDALDKIKETKPVEEDGNENGKEDEEEENGEDKDSEDEDEEEDKKKSKLAIAMVGSTPYSSLGSFRAYKVYRR